MQFAFDLWARDPQGQRVIFEAKTLAGSELERLRSAGMQLLEYRYFYGAADDRLCVLTDRPVSDRQARFLGSLDIAVIRADGDTIQPASPLSTSLVASLLDANLPTGKSARTELERLHGASFPTPAQERRSDTSAAAATPRRARGAGRESDIAR